MPKFKSNNANKCTDCGKPCGGLRCKQCQSKRLTGRGPKIGAKHGPVVYYKRGEVIINGDS